MHFVFTDVKLPASSHWPRLGLAVFCYIGFFPLLASDVFAGDYLVCRLSYLIDQGGGYTTSYSPPNSCQSTEVASPSGKPNQPAFTQVKLKNENPDLTVEALLVEGLITLNAFDSGLNYISIQTGSTAVEHGTPFILNFKPHQLQITNSSVTSVVSSILMFCELRSENSPSLCP